jgi:hypothetical protein
MTLDYKWAIEQMAKGLTAEGIEEVAKREMRHDGYESLKRRLFMSIQTTCMWHDTEYLSDQDVIKVFTEVGKDIVERKLHRHPTDPELANMRR